MIESAIIPRKALKNGHKSDEDEVYSVDEAERIIRYLVNHIDGKNLVLLLIYLTGLRVGEVTTIKHCNVSSDHIKVENTQTRWIDDDGTIHREIKDPKIEAGFRTVPVPASYHWVLDELQNLNPESDFVFMGSNGLPYSDNNINNRLRQINAKLGSENRRSDEELLEKVSGIQEFQTDYRNHQVLLQEVPTGSHPS